MAFNLVRHVLRPRPGALPMVQRAMCSADTTSTSVTPTRRTKTMVYAEDMGEAAPLAGNREIVCHGYNGQAFYEDVHDYPLPAITFKDMTTAQFQALRKKEMGDWKLLSVEDKKELYRGNFQATFAEFSNRHKGEWKATLCQILGFATLTFIVTCIFQKVSFNPPITHTKEWQKEFIIGNIRKHYNPVFGYPTWYDYEKKEFKVKFDRHPIN